MTNKSNLPEAWFAKADADLRAAELVIDIDSPLVDIACYHAQQCTEKYLKGYLIAFSIQFRFVHELAYLTRLCMEQNPEFSALLNAAAELQEYATSGRYPDEEAESLSLEDAYHAIDCAALIRTFIRQQI